jgi:uncharacterized protein
MPAMARPNKSAAGRSQPSPLRIDISRLGRRPGSMTTVDETVASPFRIGLDLIAIEKGAPIDLDLRLESVSEGVLVTGTVSAPTAGQCARCLSPITGDVEIYLTELFAYPDTVTESTTEEDEVGRIVDDYVNLEQVIIDAVGLELPLSPLCGDDCPGLCVQCGVALAAAGPDHQHDVIDPRWAKLAGFASGETTSADRAEPQDGP